LNPLKRLAGQTAVYGLSSIIGRLLNYLLVPLYTRVLITSEYGVVTEMYAYVSILWVILTYGMETTYFRFSESEKDKNSVYNTAFLSVVFTSVLFGVLVLFNSDGLAHWLGYSGHTNYVVWFGIILAFDAITAIPFAKLRQQNKAIRFALIKLVNIGVNIGLNLFFILLCPYILKHHHDGIFAELINSFFNPDDMVGYIFISNLIASTITLMMLLPEIRLRKINFDTRLWYKMLAYTWPLLIVSVAGSINLSLDKILLPRLLPQGTDVMAQVGIYGACYKVSIIMSLFVQTFRYAADPFFFSESSKNDSRQLFADVFNYFTIAVSLIFLFTMMYIDIVIRFIGVDYREGAGVIPILLMGNLFLGIYYTLSIWYKLTNQTIYGAVISAIGAILSVVLNFIFIPSMGYYGSAWAAFTAYTVMMVMSYFLGQKYFPIPYNLRKFVIYTGLPVLFYMISYYLKIENLYQRLAFNTLLVISYLAVLGYDERKNLQKLFLRK